METKNTKIKLKQVIARNCSEKSEKYLQAAPGGFLWKKYS